MPHVPEGTVVDNNLLLCASLSTLSRLVGVTMAAQCFGFHPGQLQFGIPDRTDRMHELESAGCHPEHSAAIDSNEAGVFEEKHTMIGVIIFLFILV